MKKIVMAAIALACAMGGAAALRAQDQATMGKVPKVLLIIKEPVKVGKGHGHSLNEAAFVKAAMAVKMPDRYLAVTTMTGPSEAWFLEGFDSYTEFEKTNRYDEQPKVTSAVGPIMEKDAEFVSEGSEAVATYREDWSYKPDSDIPSMRYFEVETLRLKPGHDKDWAEIIKTYKAAAEKMNLDEHDIFFEVHYGAPAGTIYIFTPRKSLAELDQAAAMNKSFEEALGPDGQKRWAELLEAAIAADTTNLVEFSPEMSFPPEDWAKADPSFWKPKMAMAPKAGAEAKKPAEAPKQ